VPARRRLDQGRVIEAALALLDERGLDGLTTRRLAERLGVRSASLYWHVRDKEELLDLLAERIMAEIVIPDPSLPWRERVEALMTGFRRSLLAHHDAARILAGRPPLRAHQLAVAEAALSALLDAGLEAGEAAGGVGLLVSYVTGFALDEAAELDVPAGDDRGEAFDYAEFLAALPVDRYPTLVQFAGQIGQPARDSQFAYGMGFLLDGLTRRGRPAAGHPELEMKAADVLELYRLFDENGIEVHVDGGWGVDALLGEQTRTHRDLDIAMPHEDVPRLRGLLEARGYRDVPRDDTRDCNFVLGDDSGRQVDVHSYTFDDAGRHVFGIEYPFESLAGSGTVNGQPVRCITAEWQVRFHSGYELDEDDRNDVGALCARFDILLPEQPVPPTRARQASPRPLPHWPSQPRARHASPLRVGDLAVV
jgi:lincosamide nucleotidyltransferase A/C/D/E